MGTHHTGIPLSGRNIQPPLLPVTFISISKTITDELSDTQTFHVSVIGDNGFNALNVPITQTQPLLFQRLQYGTYTIIEATTFGYTLTSIIPSTFTISADNPQQSVSIVNSKDPVITPIKYGLLYNWYAASKNVGTGVGSIAPDGYHVPSDAEFITLITELGGELIAGELIKESGTTYWNTDNGINTSKLSLRGTGLRWGGVFNDIKTSTYLWSTNEHDTVFGNVLGLYDNLSISLVGASEDINKDTGLPIILIKDTSDWSEGETVTDYDGNIYPTVKIGDQVWMAANLAVTHYNNGDVVPEVTDNATWAALTTGALCAYDNDHNNI